MRHARGFSLLETMIVLGLVGTILVVLSGLLNDYFRGSRDFKQSAEQRFVLGAFPTLERDIQSAKSLTLNHPDNLQLIAVRIEAAGRFSAPLNPGGEWQGDGPAFQSRVRYDLNNSKLRRRSQPQNQESTILRDVLSLNFEVDDSRKFTVTLSLEGSKGPLVFQRLIYVPSGVEIVN